MVVDGQWLVPHVGGKITTDKPPLFFWLIAFFSIPFGAVSAFTARLPSVVAALGSVYLTILLGRRMFDQRTGVLAGAILITTHMFWDKARWSQIDSLLCFLILLALFCFEGFRSGKMSGRSAGIVFWAAIALAILAKGPVGLAVPLGVALTTLAFDRSLSSWRRFAPIAGPVAFSLIVGSWLVAVTFWGGEYSVLGALREHVVERAIHGMHHEQPPWYYLTVLPYALLPWSFLLPGALLLAWRRRVYSEDRFLLVYFLFVVVFFSIPTEKRDLYILPSIPAFSLLTARLVTALSRSDTVEGGEGLKMPDPRWATVALGLVGGIFVAVAVALPFFSNRIGPELVRPGYFLAVVLGLGGLTMLTAALRGRVMTAVQSAGATMAVAMLVTVTVVYPAIDPSKSGRELAYVVRDQTVEYRASGNAVLGLDLGNVPRSVSFYSNGIYLEELDSGEQLVAELGERLAIDHEMFLLVDEESLPALPQEIEARRQVLYETRLSRRHILFLRFGP